MMKKSLMAGLIALLAWTGFARAQGGLGGPVPTETPAESSTDFKVRPYRPVLNFLTRNRVSARTTSLVSPPQPEGPTRDEVARMVQDGGFSPAEIAAAKVKLDEIQARSRQAAVKYLATVDCLYYPEAEASLIAALRADRNEVVRLEAATAIGSCRGVTVRILDALHLTATAQETDGNPAEPSERVRSAARISLNKLLSSGLSAGGVDFLPAMVNRPTPASVLPAAQYLPPAPASPPVSQHERDIAATVSVQPKSAASPTVAARPTLYDYWRNFVYGRDAAAAPGAVDPRLRGLTPLGSEPPLAIPANRAGANSQLP
jgi:hypothetical protein